MKARKRHEEPMDMRLFQELKQAREDGGITDDDRVVFFAHDEPIRLYSAFGHGCGRQDVQRNCRGELPRAEPEHGEGVDVMDIAKLQIDGLLRGAADVLTRTVPTLLVILWISSKAMGWGLSELLKMLAESQPFSALLKLITGP